MREELSACEAPIMKIIWESEPDISIPELTQQLNVRYGKEYARTTVVTFLTRLAGKGYITTERRGRVSYARALKSEQEYKQTLASKQTEFWFHGSLSEFVQALSMGTPITKEELQKVRELLDEMERMEKMEKMEKSGEMQGWGRGKNKDKLNGKDETKNKRKSKNKNKVKNEEN